MHGELPIHAHPPMRPYHAVLLNTETQTLEAQMPNRLDGWDAGWPMAAFLKAVPGPYPQALRWSDGNLLAVASGSFVTILVRLKNLGFAGLVLVLVVVR